MEAHVLSAGKRCADVLQATFRGFLEGKFGVGSVLIAGKFASEMRKHDHNGLTTR